MKSLVWFRNDLRIDDNQALKNACMLSSEVHCVYLYSLNQNEAHNEANCKTHFIIENLKSLEEDLGRLNIPLTVIDSNHFLDDPNKILQIVKERNLQKVFWNNQVGFDEIQRDDMLKKVLDENNIKYSNYENGLVYSPGTLRTGNDRPYSVFTPFKRKWIENFNIDLLDIEFNYTPKNNTDIKSNTTTFDFRLKKTHSVDMSLWPVGEKEAYKRLNDYLDQKVLRYSKDRNDPIIDGTSRLSPYFASGVISPRRCILEALKRNNFELDSNEIGIVKWIDEIVWREFYKNIMFCFPRVSKDKPFQEYTENIKWRHDESELDAWKNGETGFPIIDAAMKQLKTEGWMHNRLRMVTAMFFTKNMLHDWKIGEAFFMQNLMDGDFSSNNGGWQWSSSTGTDAAPYFRIFNPLTQSKNFDKSGFFIKKYISELEDLDAKEIHSPASNIRSHLGYPEQILDLKESRLRAIEAFNSARN